MEIGAIKKTARIDRLKRDLFAGKPVIESARARLLTESYKATEGQPTILRRAKAFEHILKYIPIVIRPDELIVGSTTVNPRSAQTYPEFSFQWLEDEFDTIAARSADPFLISEEDKAVLREAHQYWRGKTTSELALSYMTEDTLQAIDHNIFTVGNYLYNGVGHVTVDYALVLEKGFGGIAEAAKARLAQAKVTEPDYPGHSHFWNAVIICCDAAVLYAKRYAELARKEAEKEQNPARKQELYKIAANCEKVPLKGAESFYEACQSFWFVQQLIQIESNGHSISPGRFDQYMYPYYRKDMEKGLITAEEAQELIDCIWVKFNDLSKVRDKDSAAGFAGYGAFQNLIVGGQDGAGTDATNDLSYMCIQACMHVRLPQPSFSIRVWNKTPWKLMEKAAELTKTGLGLPAYYNDEVIIPALVNRGLTIEDARQYNIIGCVEPQKSGKTDGWHDAAFFNMCRPLELVFSNGVDKGVQIGPRTGSVESLDSFEKVWEAYGTQMTHFIGLMVNADNAVDYAHKERAPLPFLSCMVEDCIGRGMSVQEGGAVYNFTGPQGFGIANVTDSLLAVRQLVFEEHKLTLAEYKDALEHNFGMGTGDLGTLATGTSHIENSAMGSSIAGALAMTETQIQAVAEATRQVLESMKSRGLIVSAADVESITKRIVAEYTGTAAGSFTKALAGTSTKATAGGSEDAFAGRSNSAFYQQLLDWIKEVPKYGNDIDEADYFAREVAYTYTREVEKYTNPRGGQYQAGLYPVSANVPLGAQTGATPDGRLAGTPIADGVSPGAGRDVNGPTAAANSVAKLDHYKASNGTLFNQKFHPSALEGEDGIRKFIQLVQVFFEKKGSHVQFNVVSRETLLDAQKHPEQYSDLVVRVAGYSALFTTLSKSLQDDIIQRTEQRY